MPVDRYSSENNVHSRSVSARSGPHSSSNSSQSSCQGPGLDITSSGCRMVGTTTRMGVYTRIVSMWKGTPTETRGVACRAYLNG